MSTHPVTDIEIGQDLTTVVGLVNTVHRLLQLPTTASGMCSIIQMTHDGECDMLRYICPEVEMSTQG